MDRTYVVLNSSCRSVGPVCYSSWTRNLRLRGWRCFRRVLRWIVSLPGLCELLGWTFRRFCLSFRFPSTTDRRGRSLFRVLAERCRIWRCSVLVAPRDWSRLSLLSSDSRSLGRNTRRICRERGRCVLCCGRNGGNRWCRFCFAGRRDGRNWLGLGSIWCISQKL